MKLLFPIFLLGVSCAEDQSKQNLNYSDLLAFDGKTIEIQGVAAIEPYIKENQSAVLVDGEPVFFLGNFKSIKSDVLGKNISVKGKLVKKRWPMFILEPRNWDLESGVFTGQGMPMPPGTDIEKESLYFVIESPQWKIN
ncbi:MAG: hypothetical protein L3J39_06620 [Verrucomicrobiales bacterium]|nr:hypothetical protein [Verrucomicrobiales bacterium]